MQRESDRFKVTFTIVMTELIMQHVYYLITDISQSFQVFADLTYLPLKTLNYFFNKPWRPKGFLSILNHHKWLS